MQLKRLKINSFLGVPSADIIFNDKVFTVFFGPNAQGKSSVRDALMFAFTGQARHVSKVKDVGELAYESRDKEMQVVLDVLDQTGEFSVNRTKKNPRAGVEIFHPITPYCVDPLSFLKLEPNARGRLLSGVLSEDMEDVVKSAMAKHIGVIPDEILKELKGVGVDRSDPNQFKKAIVEVRRQYKRDADPGAEPTLKDYRLPDDFDVEAVKKKYEAEQKELADLTRKRNDKDRAKRLKKELADVTKKIAEHESAKPLTQKESKAAEQLKITLTALDLAGKSVRKGDCLVCHANYPTDMWDEIIKGLNVAVGELKKSSRSASKKIDKITAAESALPGLRSTAERIGKELIELSESVDVPGDANERISELKQESERTYDVILRYGRFRQASEMYDEKIKSSEKLKTLIEECDRVDKLLADGGPVQSSIAKAGKSLPLNKELLEAWKIERLDVRNNGEIYFKGRVIEAASASEQYRVASVLGVALAELCGVGFACMDAYETLVGDVAGKLLASKIRLDNVLVFCSKAKKPTMDSDAFDAYWVEAGSVEKI